MRTQTGGPPRHPEEAAESERDYPEQGQAAPGAAAAAAGGSRLRAGPEEPPHPPGARAGGLGRSSGPGEGGKLWAEGHAQGAGGSSAHQASHLLPSGKLPRILFSGSSSTQNNPRHSQRRRNPGGTEPRQRGGRGEKPRAGTSASFSFSRGCRSLTIILHSCEGYASAERSPILSNPRWSQSCHLAAKQEKRGCRSISRRWESGEEKANWCSSPPFSSELGSPRRASSLPALTHTLVHAPTRTTPPDNNGAAPAISTGYWQ